MGLICRLCMLAVICLACLFRAAVLLADYGDNAGPYPMDTGIHGGSRLDPDAYPAPNPYLAGWATDVIDYARNGTDVTFGDPSDTLGQPGGTEDVFSLGDGGWIVLGFAQAIRDISGYDFVVWENGFFQAGTEGPEMLFAELMFVEVSTNGTDFARFPSDSRIPAAVGGFGSIDPTYVHNLAGKHPNGNDGRDEGTPFDLADLGDHPLVLSGAVNLDDINYVKLIDVVGDGSTVDASGNAVYDPYPTPFASGGADLDAVGILQASLPPEAPSLASPADGASGVMLTPDLVSEAFADPDDGDTHSKSRWQIAESDDFVSPVFDAVSPVNLVSLPVPVFILDAATTYSWRVRHIDSHGNPSDWSDVFSFTTGERDTADDNDNGVPDDQESGPITDLDQDGCDDAIQDDFKVVALAENGGQMGITAPAEGGVERVQAIYGDDLPAIPNEKDQLLGQVAFCLSVAAGATVETIAYFSPCVTGQTLCWYMYDSVSGWTDFSGHSSIEHLADDRVRIRLTLTDGGVGDSDGVANGVIVDSSGIVLLDSDASDSSAPTDTDSDVGGGCFIRSMVIQ